MSFLTNNQLLELGFGSLGKNVLISDKCSLYNTSNIFLGNDIRIDDFSVISAGDGGIYIGDYVHIACYVSLIGKGKIELQDFCGISGRTSIYSSSDDYTGNFLTNPTVPDDLRKVISATVTIGRHVIIGTGCCVLPGITIGDGAAVGACSLVTKNVNKGKFVFGIPAKVLKERSNKHALLEVILKNRQE